MEAYKREFIKFLESAGDAWFRLKGEQRGVLR